MRTETRGNRTDGRWVFERGALRIEGASLAGDSTWFRVHPPGLAFDVGRGESRLSGAADLFLTHGHLDHCLGVPFVLSHRTLHESKATRVFCPLAIAEPLRELIEASARLEGVRYRYDLNPIEPAQRFEVGAGLTVESFATSHVVPSLGYRLLKRYRRLAEAYQGLPQGEIARLRADGADVTTESLEPWVAYCGDTRIEVLDQNPSLYEVPVLLIECTFIGPGLRERGDLYGHIHLQDLEERASLFHNDVVILNHLSRRHRTLDLRQEVDRCLGDLASRVVIVGERVEASL